VTVSIFSKIRLFQSRGRTAGRAGKKLGAAGKKLKGKKLPKKGASGSGGDGGAQGRPAGQKTIVGMEDNMSGKKTMVFSEQEELPVVGWIVALNGAHKGKDFRIHEGKNIIGRGPGVDIVITDNFMSSRHASIKYEDGTFQLTDLDSKNGTFINETQISSQELIDHDEIKFGETRFQFVCLNL
jgi:hypothetical protein